MPKYQVNLAFPVWVEAKDAQQAEANALRLATAGALDEMFHRNVELLNHAYELDADTPIQLPN
jgi:hypothetical protein